MLCERGKFRGRVGQRLEFAAQKRGNQPVANCLFSTQLLSHLPNILKEKH
jgi:hypothetical protein